MEIEKIMSLSSGYIRESTSQWLDDTPSIVVYPKEVYGWFIYVNIVNLDEYVAGIPDDLERALRYAALNECTWINLDCSVEIDNGLPVYEWKM